MTKPVTIDAEAEEDLDEAMARSATLGATTQAKFRQAIRDLWTILEANPGIGAKIPRTGFRQFPMVGYPYYVVYREEPDRLRVLVFGDAHRKPNYWKKRLRNP